MLDKINNLLNDEDKPGKGYKTSNKSENSDNKSLADKNSSKSTEPQTSTDSVKTHSKADSNNPQEIVNKNPSASSAENKKTTIKTKEIKIFFDTNIPQEQKIFLQLLRPVWKSREFKLYFKSKRIKKQPYPPGTKFLPKEKKWNSALSNESDGYVLYCAKFVADEFSESSSRRAFVNSQKTWKEKEIQEMFDKIIQWIEEKEGK